MKKFKQIIPLVLVLVLLLSYTTTSMAYSNTVRGMKVPGSGTNKVLSNGARTNSSFSMTLYEDSIFNGQVSMTFRLFRVGGSSDSDRRSNALTLKAADANAVITKPFLNGGENASSLDMRASTSGSSDAYFNGVISF